jgi:hypothetical protein
MKFLALLPLLLIAAPALAEDKALLRLEVVELDEESEGWTVENGKIVETSADGLCSATYTWLAPPEEIVLGGFDVELSLEGKAKPDAFCAPISYVSGPYVFDPDPPNLPLYLNGDTLEGSETLKVHVAPMSASLAGGTYTLDIGAAYGKAVHYVYRTVPQLVP